MLAGMSDGSRSASLPGARVFGVLALVQLFFGIHYTAVKELLVSMDPAAWATLRILLAAAILQAWVRMRGAKLPRGLHEWLPLIGFAACGVVINQVCFVEGLSRTTPSHSLLLNTTIPLWTVAIAVGLRRETLTARRAAGLLCGLAGVWTLLRADRFHLEADLLTGDLITMVNAASYGLFLVVSKRWVATRDPLVVTADIFAIGAVGVAVYGLPELLTVDPAGLPPSFFLWAAYAVLFATVAAHGMNLWALRRADSSQVALFIYLQPLVATAVDGIARGIWPSWRFYPALALVFLGVWLSLKQAKNRSRSIRP